MRVDFARRGGFFPLLFAAALTACATSPAGAPVAGGAARAPIDLALVHVAVVDVERGRVLRDHTVLISADRIDAVGPSGTVTVPPAARVVDGRGKYLVPGLWDMHVHSAAGVDWHFPLLVAHGVTGVRNMHSTVDDPLALTNEVKRRLDAGELLGPRFVANGPILDGEPPAWPGALVVRDAAEARAAVDALADGGADFVKVYDNLSREAYFAIAEQAKRRGLPMDGHLPFAVRPEEAAAAGQRTIEHLSGIESGCSSRAEAVRAERPRVAALAFPERLVGLFRLERELYDGREPALCAATAAAYRRHGTMVLPNLVIARNSLWPEEVLADEETLRFVPATVLPSWRQRAAPGPGDQVRLLMRPTWPQRLENVHLLHEAGVPILAGSDIGNPFLVPGVSLHQELALLVEAGLTPLEALRAATLNPARALAATDSLGTVAPGKLADLVLLAANPLEDVANTREIVGVVLGGHYLDRSALDDLLAQVAARAARTTPDTILHNARVFTADPARPWAEAVAVAGERIVSVGTDAEVTALAGEATRLVDLEGRLVIPGLNDAHLHVGPSPETTWLDLGGGQDPDPTWAEVEAAVAAAATEAPVGHWIMGTVGPTVFADAAANRPALAAAARGRPVMLRGWMGHGAILSAAARERLGVATDAAETLGGWSDRPAGDELRDHFPWELLDGAIARRLTGSLPREASVAAYRDLAAAAVRWGITSVQHVANSLPLAETVAGVEEAQPPIRWSILRWTPPELGIAAASAPPTPTTAAGSKVRVSGVKWLLDGTPIERLAAMRQPYADRPGWSGRLRVSPAEMREILQAALASDEVVALHAAGDRSLELVLRTMEELAPAETWRRRRIRIEHGDGMAHDLVPRARDLGVVLVQNPLHLTLPDLMQARLGPRRATEYGMLRTPLEAGIPLALGADAGGAAVNPFLNLMFAVLHPAIPSEGLTLEQALTAYTRGSAFAERAEADKGTLAPGMLADLAVLSQDIFAVPLEALPGTTSVLTMVGGEIVHRVE